MPRRCENCNLFLRAVPDYEDHVGGWDEDKGEVIDVYEVRRCGSCHFENRTMIGDRPA